MSTVVKIKPDAIQDNSISINKLSEEFKTSLNGNFRYINEELQNMPFGKGDAENSAVLKGGNNQAISEFGIALGKDNVSGLKGYYYKSINFDNKKIYLTIDQKTPTYGDSDIEDIICEYEIGEVISIICDNKYYNCSTITKIEKGVITVDNLPFDDYKFPLYNAFDDWSLFSITKPKLGLCDIGKYTFTEGFDNKALSFASHSEGAGNTSIGHFSHTEGQQNEAHYSAHAEGWGTKAIGTCSHSEGESTTASGVRSHTEGYNTKATRDSSHAEGITTTAEGYSSHAEGESTTASGSRSHAEGYSTTASGKNSHAEGESTTASGSRSHAEGYGTKAKGNTSHAEGLYTIVNNSAEHASGQYNKSTKSNDKAQATQFSIGIGISDEDRKNAFEVKQNGDIYIAGLTGVLQDYLAGAITGVIPLLPIKIQTFGDSITDNTWGDNSSWVSFIPDNISSESLTVINSAVAGAAIGLRRETDILSQVTSGCTRSDGSIAPPLDIATDIVVVFGGTNDYSAGFPIEDASNNLAEIFEFISSNSQAKILFCTPLQRYNGADQGFNTNDEGIPINSLGKTLREYCEELIRVCVRYSVPVCDLNAESNINRFNLSNYSSDGLHPNIDGDTYLSKIICKRIKELAETL